MSFVEVFFPEGAGEFDDVFQNAAAFWNGVITSSAASPTVFNTAFSVNANTNCGVDFTFPAGSGFESLAIFASVVAIDGVNNVLGRAGPCVFDGIVPIMGIMEFDVADVENLVASGNFEEVIRHEMAHVIGIGTVWTREGFVTNPCNFFSVIFGCDPTYNQPQGNAGFAELGGSGPAPVANTGGSGTFNGHWREVTFENELMTGFLSEGVNPVSIMTVKALIDMGYGVDLNAAEDYTLPVAGSARSNLGHIDLNADSLDILPVDINDVMTMIEGKSIESSNNTEMMAFTVGLVGLIAGVMALVAAVAYRRKGTKQQEAKVTEVSAKEIV